MQTPSIHFKDFVNPPLERLLTPNSLVFFVLNVLTGGIYGASEAVSKEHKIRLLENEQENLQGQVADLMDSWDKLERKVINLLEHLRQLNPQDDQELEKCDSDFEKLSREKNQLQAKVITVVDVPSSISELAFGTISFIGRLLANILSLGFVGVYQNYSLKNKIKILEAKNKFVQQTYYNHGNERQSRVEEIIEYARTNLNINKDLADMQDQLEEMKKTEPGKAYLEAHQAKIDIENLQKKQADLQRDLSVLKADKVGLERTKHLADKELREVQQELARKQDQAQRLAENNYKFQEDLNQMRDKFEKKTAEFEDMRRKKDADLNKLQVKILHIDNKGKRVKELTKELDKLKEMGRRAPEIQRLQGEVGAIPPKYTPRKEDGAMEGAIDVIKKLQDQKAAQREFQKAKEAAQKAKENNDAQQIAVDGNAEEPKPDPILNEKIDPKKLKWAQDYFDRYGEKPCAAEVVLASFDYSIKQLLEMAAEKKIMFNNSEETGLSPGYVVVFRLMVLDLLDGAKVSGPDCQGNYELVINRHVSMLPSKPEKILHYKIDETTQQIKPEVVVKFTKHDDFTPSEDKLDDIKEGVDCISAKWILAQLTDEELRHLLNLLMSPVIEESHPDLKKTREFMQDQKNPRVQLIFTGYNLIQDLAVVIDKKFNSNVLASAWDKHCNSDIEPFIKPDDVPPKMDQIKDDVVVQGPQGGKQVEWVIDEDALTDHAYPDASQAQFFKLVTDAQIRLKTFYQHIDQHLVAIPYEKNEEHLRMDFDKVNSQYHVSHQMLGQFHRQHCLFSNLLAILVTDKDSLTEENVLQLRKALAAYLDTLEDARMKWETKQIPIDKEEAKKLKELAVLGDGFKKAIKKTHSCSVANYQNWLRGINNNANIEIGNLPTLPINLAAYAFNVRIGVLPVNVQRDCPTQVDEFGRIIPVGEIYGPNTKEMLLMACTGGSYYGLFPKLNLENNDEFQSTLLLSEDFESYGRLEELEQYWQNIDMNLIERH